MSPPHPYFALALVTVGVASACSKPKATEERPKGPPPAIPVEVQRLEPRTVEYAVTAVGSVEAFESVQVTARVAGVLERLHFKEGDRVAKDALLAEIEPRRYELAYASSKAALDRSSAAREEAARELERAQKMLAEGVSTGLEVSSWQTRLQTAIADEAQARASLGLAALNVKEARLRAPFAGVIQTRNVQTGQYVQAGTVLATLLQREPLLLRFKVLESEAARLSLGKVAHFKLKDVSTEHSAKITFVAGAAEATSRMVPVTAEVIAEEASAGALAALRPGSFAEVRVPIESIDGALVAPQSAVRPSERGFLAYVVEDGVARERVLDLGMRTPDGLVEIKSGLKAGESVVVRGTEALREGAKVKVSTVPTTLPSGATRPPAAGGEGEGQTRL